uniref:Methyltransferase-like protein 17, mitochondrial n=1 Tax=Panagrolaimus sp. PS1159 TaxID=55785 RepID=A0AC35FRU4_9BILA
MRPSCSLLTRVAASISARETAKPKPEYNRTYENGQVHVTSINPGTNEHSVYRLSPVKNYKATKGLRFFPLPEQAVEGLKVALVNCQRPAKQLQHEADQMTEKLNQRRFPASPKEVQAARREIVGKIRSKENNDEMIPFEMLDEKIKKAHDNYLQKEVQKKLKKTRFNWKALEFGKSEEAAAFSLSRLAPYFAEVKKVLSEFERNGFKPETILDYGGGCGSAFWAVREQWGDDFQEYCFIDTNDLITQFAMDIMRGSNSTEPGLISKKLYFRRALIPSLQNKYDLVIIHRTLIEIGSHEQRLELISRLWQRTNKYLVIIESDMEDAFSAIIQARNFILTNSVKIDSHILRQTLEENNLMSEEMSQIIYDKQMSYSEKYCLIREKLSDPNALPTFIEHGHVYAPCPHDLGCPKIDLPKGKKSCKFFARWNEIRADGKTKSKKRDGTGVSAFSYVILEKGHRPGGVHPGRLLDKKTAGGCVTCTVCTPFDGLQRFPISKRAGPIYQLAKGAESGQLFPLEGNVVQSEIGLLNL